MSVVLKLCGPTAKDRLLTALCRRHAGQVDVDRRFEDDPVCRGLVAVFDGEGMTLDQIAMVLAPERRMSQRVRVSAERVRQILSGAMRKLRHTCPDLADALADREDMASGQWDQLTEYAVGRGEDGGECVALAEAL